MEYTKEQVKAAYALNLCTVSVSQIIDYDDINIMEQEYEAILNNLNLEQIPKDEALLNILKQIMNTITYFRIQEGDKKFIEKDYQQKMKNAVWAAVPNIGLLVAGGNPVTMAVSLASQVGIGYMNYRKAKAEGQLGLEKQKWELERAAIDQFNGLRRELFDTAWRLADKYNFPDELRLSERQIKQYNTILMDTDLIRKHERLDTIKKEFVAYPPFWYHYGNAANAISRSDLNLDDNTRAYYRKIALDAFMQYRESNQQGLLREDPISSANALELIDLLDTDKDSALINELLKEAVAFSGREEDVLQLAAISYIKIQDLDGAADLLKQLVNEQYNTALNSQLLSSVYVSKYIKEQSPEIKAKYDILGNQVGEFNLYPMPDDFPADEKELEEKFLKQQREVILKKYLLMTEEFAKKYSIAFGEIVPVAQEKELNKGDLYYLNDPEHIENRKSALKSAFAEESLRERYVIKLRDAAIPYRIIDVLNDFFEAVCSLDFIDSCMQDQLASDIEDAIYKKKENVLNLWKKASNGDYTYDDICNQLDLNFNVFTEKFFEDYNEALIKFIDSRTSLEDFSLAEMDLNSFCKQEKIPHPSELLENTIKNIPSNSVTERRFSYESYGQGATSLKKSVNSIKKMTQLINDAIPAIVKKTKKVEFYLREDPRADRYFSRNKYIRQDKVLKSKTLAILDDTSKKDSDLLFVIYGIIPVKNGLIHGIIPYNKVSWANDKRKELIIDGKFVLKGVDVEALYNLIRKLKKYASTPPDLGKAAPVKLPDINLPDIKLPIKLPQLKNK